MQRRRLMDQLSCDKDLVESLGGNVDAVKSVLPAMAAAVVIVVILAAAVVVVACKLRKYD